MTERELISMLTEELTEYKLGKYCKRNNASCKILKRRISKLRVKTKNILKEIPKEQAHIINEYIEKSAMMAKKDCLYLYRQGVKDCVRALKQLGVI